MQPGRACVAADTETNGLANALASTEPARTMALIALFMFISKFPFLRNNVETGASDPQTSLAVRRIPSVEGLINRWSAKSAFGTFEK